MGTEQGLPLEELDKDQLLEQLEGGLYSLITENPKYEQLAQMAIALGIKDFVRNTYSDAAADDIADVFADGETALVRFVSFVGERGLLDLDGDDE